MPFFVAPPICAGNCGELHGLDNVGVHKVRSAAEVGECTVLVICDGAVFELADKLTLVRVALGLEILHRIGLGDLYTLEFLTFAGEFEHLLFNLFEVGVGECPATEVNVIVEPAFNCRADTELDSGIKGFEGFGHKVR